VADELLKVSEPCCCLAPEVNDGLDFHRKPGEHGKPPRCQHEHLKPSRDAVYERVNWTCEDCGADMGYDEDHSLKGDHEHMPVWSQSLSGPGYFCSQCGAICAAPEGTDR
jgi:hypothetical protein